MQYFVDSNGTSLTRIQRKILNFSDTVATTVVPWFKWYSLPILSKSDVRVDMKEKYRRKMTKNYHNSRISYHKAPIKKKPVGNCKYQDSKASRSRSSNI